MSWYGKKSVCPAEAKRRRKSLFAVGGMGKVMLMRETGCFYLQGPEAHYIQDGYWQQGKRCCSDRMVLEAFEQLGKCFR